MQFRYSAHELLADHPHANPNLYGVRRLHGGYGADGSSIRRALSSAGRRSRPPGLAGELPEKGRRDGRRQHPHHGANMKPDSIRADAPEIEFTRERFPVSKAVTCHQLVLNEIFKKQGCTD
ncbi:MAG: hypothetical protein WBL20_01545 [Sphingobium sp.]